MNRPFNLDAYASRCRVGLPAPAVPVSIRSRRLIASVESAYLLLDVRVSKGMTGKERYATFMRVLFRLHRNVGPLFDRVGAPGLCSLRQYTRLCNLLTAWRIDLLRIGTSRLGDGLSWAETMGRLFVAGAANLYAKALYRSTVGRGALGRNYGVFQANGMERADQQWRAQLEAVGTLILSAEQEREMIEAAAEAVRHLQHGVKMGSS